MVTHIYIHLGVALAGLVSFLSPCVLPLVPPYLGYLGGMTIEQMTADGGLERSAWRRVVLASLCFVLGFTTVFVGLGAGASVFGQLIQTYKTELSIGAGIVIILFGLHFLGLLRIPLLYREARYHAKMEGATFPAPMSSVSPLLSAGPRASVPCWRRCWRWLRTRQRWVPACACCSSIRWVSAFRSCWPLLPSVHSWFHAAVPPALRRGREGHGGVAGRHRHHVPDGLHELARPVAHRERADHCRVSRRWPHRSPCKPRS